MLSALRRKPPEVRWANGRMVPTIADLMARQVTHRPRNSKPKSPILKRSSKAQSRPLSSLAQHRRPLQVNRAGNSARAREPTVTTSAAGAFSAVRGLGMETVACTAQQSTYINHHPSHSPDSCRSSNTGWAVTASLEDGAVATDVDPVDIRGPPPRDSASGASGTTITGRSASCCSACAGAVHSCSADDGRRDVDEMDADGGVPAPPSTATTTTTVLAQQGGQNTRAHLAGEPGACGGQSCTPATFSPHGCARQPAPEVQDFEHAAGAAAGEVFGGRIDADVGGGERSEDDHHLQGSRTDDCIQVSI